MENSTRRIAVLVSLFSSLDKSFVKSLLSVIWRILAAVKDFSNGEVTPQSFERVERRLESLARGLARLLLEYITNNTESTERPEAINREHQTFTPNRRTWQTMETRVGPIQYRRWIFQTEYSGVSCVAPLDLRLGLIGGRVSPGVAHKLGRLAADLPQQPALQQLEEQFGVQLSVEAYRRIMGRLSNEIRYLHDEVATKQLLDWIAEARKSSGKHEVLLLVGRDGVHVPMRESWKEAACSTLTVFDRNRKRLGTVYLGEMPQAKQVTMTERLTKMLTDVLKANGLQPLKLRYVTDAGSVPRSYFRKVLSPMKHPLSGKPLQWSWGVDFFHACEYVSLLANALFGVGTAESQRWYREQRHSLRHDQDGIKKVLARAAQNKRRHGLQGSESDYQRARDYLRRYRAHMDYAARKEAGDPIGSGVTEAACKVIFNQRMKQSGMRWKRRSGQWIVDLRTACRSGIWDRIWKRGLNEFRNLPDITRSFSLRRLVKA